jgi:hypothetical protein
MVVAVLAWVSKLERATRPGTVHTPLCHSLPRLPVATRS